MSFRPSIALSPVVLLLFGGLLVGCAAQEPSTSVTDPQPIGDLARPRTNAGDMALPSDGHVDPPVLDALAQQSAYLSFPVHGTAAPGTTVLIEGTDAGAVAAQVSVSGRFCAEVQLVANGTTSMSLHAVDANGNESPSVSLVVTQAGAPQQGPAMPMPVNASIGGSATSHGIGALSTSPGSNAIDANMGTSINGSIDNLFSWSSPAPTVTVKLAQTSRINRVRAVATPDCLILTNPEIWVSSADSPSSPDVQPMAWVKVPSTVSDDKLEVVANIPSTIASHVAIMWPVPGITTDLNCGHTYSAAWYAVAELEAWTVPNVAPPPPTAPTCAGGSN